MLVFESVGITYISCHEHGVSKHLRHVEGGLSSQIFTRVPNNVRRITCSRK